MGDITQIDDLDLEDFEELEVIHEVPDPMEAMLSRDPAALSYPPTLPIEVALRTAPPEELREEYGYTRDEWRALRANEMFRADVAAAIEALKAEGMSFKMKAKLQAEELLRTSWRMIHDKTNPAPVRADLLKFTIRAAGLDGSKDQAAGSAVAAMQININL